MAGRSAERSPGIRPRGWPPNCVGSGSRTALRALVEEPERDRCASDHDPRRASLPDLECERADRRVRIEDCVAAQELAAAAEVSEDVGFDGFAVKWMRVRDRGVRESMAVAVIGRPLNREQDFVPP